MNRNLGVTLLDRFHAVDSVALDALLPSTSRDSATTSIRTQTTSRERERDHRDWKTTLRRKKALFKFLLLLLLQLSLAGHSGHFIWVRLQQPQKQHYPFLPMCAVFPPHVQTMIRLPVFRVFDMRTLMVMHAIAYGGCTSTMGSRDSSVVRVPDS